MEGLSIQCSPTCGGCKVREMFIVRYIYIKRKEGIEDPVEKLCSFIKDPNNLSDNYFVAKRDFSDTGNYNDQISDS